MDVTSSTNIKAFSSNQSYADLKKNHFDIEDRELKGISKNKDLESLNRYFGSADYQKNLELKMEKAIDEYNKKPSQVKNKSRRYENLSDYIDKKQSRSKVNADFHGVSFMMVSKLADMDSWNEIVDTFKSKGFEEEEVLNVLNDSFVDTANHFNRTYASHGLSICEMNTNLDETGSPHFHANVILERTLKNGLPDTNFASGLKSKFGDRNNKELMQLFRDDIDSKLVEYSNERLKSLGKIKGFEFEGLNFIRSKAERVGMTHQRYMQDKDLERKEIALNSREIGLDIRETELNTRETQLNAFRDVLDKKQDEISKSETELLTKQNKALEDKQKIIDEANAKADEIIKSAEGKFEEADPYVVKWLKSKKAKDNRSLYDWYSDDKNREIQKQEEIKRKQNALFGYTEDIQRNSNKKHNGYEY